MNTPRLGWATWILALALTSCGGGGGGLSAGGGSSGTGISSVVGNVSEVSIAQAEVGGIAVSVLGTSFSTTTDAAGAFALSGDFGGDLVLNFRRTVDALDADLPILVPTGGTLDLMNVTLDASMGSATPGRQTVDFDGTVLSADCPGNTLRVASLFDTSIEYLVRLDGAFLHDEAGNAIACTDLVVGSRLDVEGTIAPDGSIIDGDLEVEDDDGNSGMGGDDPDDDGNSGMGGDDPDDDGNSGMGGDDPDDDGNSGMGGDDPDDDGNSGMGGDDPDDDGNSGMGGDDPDDDGNSGMGGDDPDDDGNSGMGGDDPDDDGNSGTGGGDDNSGGS